MADIAIALPADRSIPGTIRLPRRLRAVWRLFRLKRFRKALDRGYALAAWDEGCALNSRRHDNLPRTALASALVYAKVGPGLG